MPQWARLSKSFLPPREHERIAKKQKSNWANEPPDTDPKDPPVTPEIDATAGVLVS